MVSFDDEALTAHRRLVSRIAAGDAEALRLLYHELSPVVHGIARRMLEDPEDAREVVQDTFVKVWRQANAYHAGRGEVVAWLVFMARNAAIDRVRQGARRHRLQTFLARERESDGLVPPVPEAVEQADLLDNHLGGLSEPQRRALELAFFSGYSQAEIAAAMRTPVGNVKNHLRRGLSKLRQLIASHA